MNGALAETKPLTQYPSMDTNGDEGRAEQKPRTHEDYIAAVRAIAAARLRGEEKERLERAKLIYGSGRPGTRGITHYNAWTQEAAQALMEVCAFGEESLLQLAGTVIHEAAHVVAGWGAGHGRAWKAAAERLGLLRALGHSQIYEADDFAPEVAAELAQLPEPNDGEPMTLALNRAVPRPCPLGIGTRGGKSRGKGSGSRLRLWLCACPVRVRVATDSFCAHCDVCGKAFQRKGV